MTIEIPPTGSGEDNKKTLGLVFNWQDWLPYFEEADISDAQKREMVETLWQIVVAFVDLGFDLNPQGQVGRQSCGQNLDLKALLEEAVVKSDTAEKAAEQPRHLPTNTKQKEPTP